MADNDAVTTFGRWAREGRAGRMGASHAPRAGQALDRLPVPVGGRAIDLGCGEGWASRRLAERVGPSGEVVGLDGAADMLALARAQPRAGLRYVQGDLLALPLPEAWADVAFSMEALYYVDLDAALAEAFRVLRPGGVLCACTDFYTEHDASHAWPHELDLRMDLRARAAWIAAFRNAGFEAVTDALLPDPGDPAHPGTLAVQGRRPTA